MTKKILLVVLGLLVVVVIFIWGDLLSVINPGRRAKTLISEIKTSLLTYPLTGPQSDRFLWYDATPENNLVKVQQITVSGWKITAENLKSEDNSVLNNKIHKLLIDRGFRPDPYNVTAGTTIDITGYLKDNLVCLKTNRLKDAGAAEDQQFTLEFACGLLPTDKR